MTCRTWTAAVVAAAMAGCGGGTGAGEDGATDGETDGDAHPPLSFTVDATVAPHMVEGPALAEDLAPRPLSALVDGDGGQTDFVSNEIVLVTDDSSEVAAFSERWDAEEVLVVDPSEYGEDDIPSMHLMVLGDEVLDASSLVADLRELAPAGGGEFSVSDQDGLGLLAVAARSAAEDAVVGINWIHYPVAFEDRRSMEANTSFDVDPGAYPSTNAFDWPHLGAGNILDIGVCEAWRALEHAGRLGNRVDVAVIDMGFARNADLPADISEKDLVWGWSIGEENPWSCGGSPCPWHGTMATSILASVPDNNLGAAGTGGPVVDLLWILNHYDTLSAGISVLTAKGRDVDIISMSFTTKVPTVFAWALYTFEDITESAAHDGILLFGAAGNDGENVDAEYHTPGVNWGEKAWFAPCENNGVVCVGALDWDTRQKADYSNWGHEHVDIFAPGEVWVGPDPDTAPGDIQWGGGTSSATPFAAGVAALVWAANPSLSDDDVRSVLYSTAHSSPDGHVDSYVNAWDAVVGSLDPADLEPHIEIVTPPYGMDTFMGTPVTFEAIATDLEDGTPTVTWTSSIDGVFGSGTSFDYALLSWGAHNIVAVAEDSHGHTASDTTFISLYNEEPEVTIVEPMDGATFIEGEMVTLRAISVDHNYWPEFSLPDADMVWESDVDGVLGTGHELTTTLSVPLYAPSHIVTLTGTDSRGASDEDWIEVFVDEPGPDLPPSTVTILVPATDSSHGDPGWGWDGYDSGLGLRYKDVAVEGYADDPEDGLLTGASLVWTTDRTDLQDAVVGTGESTTIRLYGSDCNETHVITLTATDSGGSPRWDWRTLVIWAVC